MKLQQFAFCMAAAQKNMIRRYRGGKTFGKRVNKFVLIIVTIIDMFLFFGYIGDYAQGHISFGFMLAVDFSVIASMIACYSVYFHRKDSAAFKHVSMAGVYVGIRACSVWCAE